MHSVILIAAVEPSERGRDRVSCIRAIEAIYVALYLSLTPRVAEARLVRVLVVYVPVPTFRALPFMDHVDTGYKSGG